jgi:asparagine synthase (glutamine-hydrolysing)
MCGIFGVATTKGRRLAIERADCDALRDLLAHRGPDDAGTAHLGHVALAHRRLALLDLEGGAQPFRIDDVGAPRVVLAWNGELYNHLELRRELDALGCRFHTRSDTETLAHLLSRFGARGLARLRGMFAIAAYFPDRDELLLARDPFGTIPLFHATVAHGGGHELVFASEPRAILSHPAMDIEPDWCSVASYLEMPRRTFGTRTLFRGLNAVAPGEAITVDLGGDSLRGTSQRIRPRAASAEIGSIGEHALRVREAVTASVATHLVADAPLSVLISGGIDSTIIAGIARQCTARLVTFSAGAAGDAARPGSDLFMARRVAKLLGTEHREVLIEAENFSDRWSSMLLHGLMPLATPNEIAISLLSEAIAPHAKATLSGEGADELFGGYGAPIEATLGWIDADIDHSPESAAAFYRTAFGWTPRGVVGELFAPSVGRALTTSSDDPLGSLLSGAFDDAGDLRSLDAHLAVQREVNLVNLLERLNLSLMIGSVEGRVPFADRGVLSAAVSAGAAHNLVERPGDDEGGIAIACGTRSLVTKRVLRHAFADLLSPEIANRPKASFPLPFERWIAAETHWLDTPIAREVFSPAGRELVRSNATLHWRLAWPVLNVARWLSTVFG